MTAYWISVYKEIVREAKVAAYREALAALDGGAVRDLRIIAGLD